LHRKKVKIIGKWRLTQLYENSRFFDRCGKCSVDGKYLMKKSLAFAMLSLSALMGSGAPIQASTVTFAAPNWVYNDTATVSWRVLIDDFTAGKYRVKISIDAPPVGDIFAFGFDSDLTGLNSASVTNVSATTVDTITGFYGTGINAQVTCGSGCNFNGIGQAFDYIVKLGAPGAASGLNTYWEFLIAHPAASLLSSFTQVGIRAQSIGTGGLSAKDYNSNPTYCQGLCAEPVEEVPLPAAFPLLAAGIGAMGLMGWRKRRNTV
jgi:PEP-CTERM motif-containing protein